jgi:hypothetical protein
MLSKRETREHVLARFSGSQTNLKVIHDLCACVTETSIVSDICASNTYGQTFFFSVLKQ